MEPRQKDRYRGYPSHGDAQMTSFSDTPSECLQHHSDQGNLKIVRNKRLSLNHSRARKSPRTKNKCQLNKLLTLNSRHTSFISQAGEKIWPLHL